MKKFYYFSKSKLKFVEIRNFYQKFVFLVAFFAILASFFVLGSFLVFDEFINPASEVKQLKNTNKALRDKLEQYSSQYRVLDDKINEISFKSNDLRLKTNLDPLPEDSEIFGTGGNSFEPIKVASLGGIDDYINRLDGYINKISLKVNLEKSNFEEIDKAFKYSEELFNVIPAICPCEGTIENNFGMRFHPILKTMRMHDGIDIITDVGTKVYAPGGGVVTFVGWRTGYGLTVEIEHGYGYKTLYGHLHGANVRQGEHINRSALIAFTGNTGELSTGPHLHYEVRHDGIALDPRNFIFDNINTFEIVKK
jgi:murein DD-endopeptidase MepM/ murein hydrolase activator NlpD